jgi:drug/metabolite transporter (DMT)-like permease
VSRVLGFLILFTCIGGLTPVFGKLAVSEIPWMTLAWVRFGTAGVLLALTQRAMGGRLPLSRATFTPLLGIAALCVPINQLGFLLGLRLANAGHAGVFYALNPVLIFWIGLALGRGVFRWSLCAATLLAFAGAVCVVASSGDLAAGDAKPDLLAGDLLLLLAIVSWALFSLLSKPYVQRHGAVGTLAAVFLLGTLLHTPFMLLDVGQVDWAAITWRGWLGAGFHYPGHQLSQLPAVVRGHQPARHDPGQRGGECQFPDHHRGRLGVPGRDGQPPVLRRRIAGTGRHRPGHARTLAATPNARLTHWRVATECQVIYRPTRGFRAAMFAMADAAARG